MQIVIDVQEAYYEALRKTYRIVSGQRSGKTLMSAIYNAVANGTPLPKGHGRLIDANELCEGRVSNDTVVIGAKCARTIIEADGGDTE